VAVVNSEGGARVEHAGDHGPCRVAAAADLRSHKRPGDRPPTSKPCEIGWVLERLTDNEPAAQGVHADQPRTSVLVGFDCSARDVVEEFVGNDHASNTADLTGDHPGVSGDPFDGGVEPGGSGAKVDPNEPNIGAYHRKSRQKAPSARADINNRERAIVAIACEGKEFTNKGKDLGAVRYVGCEVPVGVAIGSAIERAIPGKGLLPGICEREFIRHDH
jgi:hypothetical protein